VIPVPGKSLTDIAVRIVTDLVPAIQTNYGQADGNLISALLLTMAQDYERAVYNRMQDIEEIKQLCSQCLDGSNNTDLPDREALQSFIERQPDSLRLAHVTQCHGQAFELLISLHRWAEAHDEGVNLEIWRLLRRHSERNKFDIPGP
jgi:hypothetical protein